MNPTDIKIFALIDVLKSNGTIRFKNDFCDTIDIIRQTLYRIKKGHAHFTPAHIENICKVYKVNANWIFGIQPNIFVK